MRICCESLPRLRASHARSPCRQLACARIGSEEGQAYLSAMACAANYAWVNRSSMTFLARQVRGAFLAGRRNKDSEVKEYRQETEESNGGACADSFPGIMPIACAGWVPPRPWAWAWAWVGPA